MNVHRAIELVGAALRETSASIGAGLLCVALAACAVPAHAGDCVVPKDGSAATVALRAEPSAVSAGRGVLKGGDGLPLVALMKGWYETRLADGQPAFAAKRSSAIAPCPPAAASSAGGAGPAADQPLYEIHAIDVGTGLSVLVRGPDFALLYDAGSNDDMARGEGNRAIAYLKTLTPEVGRLDHVILSHPHRDHVELLPDVVSQLRPRQVWNSGAFNDICGYRNFLLAIQADPGIDYHTVTQDDGDEAVTLEKATCYGQQQLRQTIHLKHAKRINAEERVPLGQGAFMTFLYANGSQQESFNENSLVVMLELGSRRVLLMGDAEAGGRKPPSSAPSSTSVEGKLLACCAAALKADVLVVGHHGSKTSSRSRFLNAIQPSVMVISAGPTKYATVVLPDAEIVTELERRGKLFRTDLEDAACLHSPDKIGAKEDGRPGGCDNVLVSISGSGVVRADYRRLVD